MRKNDRTKIAHYVGLRVEVISHMDHCSLVCFRGRAFIVDTADLAFDKAFEKAA